MLTRAPQIKAPPGKPGGGGTASRQLFVTAWESQVLFGTFGFQFGRGARSWTLACTSTARLRNGTFPSLGREHCLGVGVVDGPIVLL